LGGFFAHGDDPGVSPDDYHQESTGVLVVR
jgi:hypothetical protein